MKKTICTTKSLKPKENLETPLRTFVSKFALGGQDRETIGTP